MALHETINFKCIGDILQKNYVKETCRWSGELSEYTHHVKNDHPSMYHYIRGNDKANFKWRLPFREDQIGTGIFNYDKQEFLYKLFYSAELESLYFSLFTLNVDAQMPIYYYKFTLGERRPIEYEGRVNSDLKQIDKPISHQTHRTVVPGEVLNNFINDYREFRWNICFLTIEDICKDYDCKDLILEDSE